MSSRAFLVLLGIASLTGCPGPAPPAPPPPAPPAPPPAVTPTPAPAAPATAPSTSAAPLDPFTDVIPGTALTLDLVPVPGDGDTPAFWMSTTEITWDLYDIFVFKLDESAGADAAGADAATRPTKPYVSMDRGFGHSGYPAISMSAKGAQAFCEWLTRKTGRTYRLPTEAEWERACGFGRGVDVDAVAWHADNADYTTHPVASKRANPLGLHDLYGNAWEWCLAADGTPVARGGSYLDGRDDQGCAARAEPSPAWNASDPQIPKSVWWLADGGFIGFRVVCDEPPAG